MFMFVVLAAELSADSTFGPTSFPSSDPAKSGFSTPAITTSGSKTMLLW